MTTPLEAIAAGVSSKAVEARTGKGWDDWFRLLDKASCRKKSHQRIVIEVRKIAEVGSWWEQMITRAYEQDRGLRKKSDAAGALRVEVSETLPVAAATLFTAWVTANRRPKWLPNCPLTIRKAAPVRTLQVILSEDASQVDVTIAPKGLRKSHVTVRHTKLRGREQVEAMQESWTRALDRLGRHCNRLL